MTLYDLFDFISNPILATTATAITAVIVALIVHGIASAILRRLFAHHPYLNILVTRLSPPLRLLLPALALQGVWAATPKNVPGIAGWSHFTLLLIIAAGAWLLINALRVVRDVIMLRFPIDTSDNLLARRVLTQTTVLLRTVSGLVILLGIAAGLMTFPEVRQIGASLLASAGLAGLVVGFAAKPVLGNLISGLQIAMAQPIRMDDVVIVEGQFGRIEEITGAFVVVKIWDERRLVVPLQWFIEHPFENWTRTGSQLLGTVFIWVDYGVPLEPIREELKRICEAAPEWDRRVCGLQVTEANERAMQVRALVSASDSGKAWDLRCKIREGLIAFLRRNYPDSLPRLRAEVPSDRPESDAALTEGASA